MPKVTFAMPFKFSPDGMTIVTYAPGEHDVSDRCAAVAAQAGALAAPASVLADDAPPKPMSRRKGKKA